MTPRRSALVLLVPEADPVVGKLRLAHDPAARAGMPAHVTLLFPFVPASRLDDVVLSRLKEQFARAPEIRGSVRLHFDRLARFPGVSYLALDNAAPVVAKIRALAAAWPEHPPYEGQFADIVPHLTVAHGDEAVLAAVESELADSLPLVAELRYATLVAEDDNGHWREHTRFALEPTP
jgi:2'-5' RNA ligase